MGKTMIDRVFQTLLLIVLITHVAKPARADELYKFVQVQCIPELNYFLFRSFDIYNIGDFPAFKPKQNQDSYQRLEKQFGVYPLSAIVNGIKCELELHTIELGGSYSPGRELGYCGGVEDAGVWVKLDGKEVLKDLPTHGGCTRHVKLEIEGEQSLYNRGPNREFYSVRACVTTLHAASPSEKEKPPQCTTVLSRSLD